MGWTAVDNELFEWLPLLTGNELKVVLAVLRESVGWHKPVATLSLSQISSLSGIAKPNLVSIITRLVRKGKLERYEYKGSYKYMIPLGSGGKGSKATQDCYLKHSPEDCPYIVTGIIDSRCLQCPRYLLHK